MSLHRPGATSRQIDVAKLRAWIAAGRPGSLRAWAHPNTPPVRTRRRSSSPRWPWWPVVALFAGVLLLAAGVAGVSRVADGNPRGVARWCISCHG